MNDIAVIRLNDSSFDVDGTLVYYIKKDKDFDNKLVEFEQLLQNYMNFQEVEDFIDDNFELVTLDEYEYEY
jgi:hypothetical protein